MINVTLTEEEAMILHDMIKTSIKDLRVEIMHTDRREYREMLKQQEIIIKKILEEIEVESNKVPA